MFTSISLKIKYHFLLPVCLLIVLPGITQPENKDVLATGYSKTVLAGITIPFGEFSQTHSIGIGAGFSWSRQRLGIMDKKPSKPLGFIAEGGIDYYFGKSETIGPYPYDYKGFTFIHTYGGLIYNCCKRGSINITTGPALGLENGFTSFWWGVNLGGAYYINKKIAINPAILLMKDQGSDPIFSGSLKASMAF